MDRCNNLKYPYFTPLFSWAATIICWESIYVSIHLNIRQIRETFLKTDFKLVMHVFYLNKNFLFVQVVGLEIIQAMAWIKLMILVFLSHEEKKKPFSSVLTCAKYVFSWR